MWPPQASVVSSCYDENNFNPCLTKQPYNMFKLWCENNRGYKLEVNKYMDQHHNL